jgi:hypothetical protein
MMVGSVLVEALTDFKRKARWAKQRVVQGKGDGEPFRIEADYLEGEKRLLINGTPQDYDAHSDSYRETLRTYARWRDRQTTGQLLGGVYPNPSFARYTYQLSGALWKSSREHRPLSFESATQLLAFDAGFAAARAGKRAPRA